ncbi:MAG: phosphatidylserine decarboxylase [Deltaproteobacteria bacterium]
MEATVLAAIVVGCALIGGGAFLFWRYIWFFRNPDRIVPQGDNLISPADGTVVYVKTIDPHDRVIVIKQGVSASVTDIVREDLASTKLLIGIFMSPFSVHFNRSPLPGRIESVSNYPPKKANLHMHPMHLRTVLSLEPYYQGSRHILENERTVTRISGQFKGADLSCYVVQIAGGRVNGIDSYIPVGDKVDKGQIFGMIRIGSLQRSSVPTGAAWVLSPVFLCARRSTRSSAPGGSGDLPDAFAIPSPLREIGRPAHSIASTLKSTGRNQSEQPVMMVAGCFIPGKLPPPITVRMSLRMSAQAQAQKPSGASHGCWAMNSWPSERYSHWPGWSPGLSRYSLTKSWLSVLLSTVILHFRISDDITHTPFDDPRFKSAGLVATLHSSGNNRPL